MLILVWTVATDIIIKSQTDLTHTQLFYSFYFSDAKMTAILDQKHYIEELNRHLSGTVTDLQAKMDSIEKTNCKLVEEVRLCELLCDCVCTLRITPIINLKEGIPL